MKKPGVKWVRRSAGVGGKLLSFPGRRVELRDGLGALGDGVLGELAGEDEADGRLDLARS